MVFWIGSLLLSRVAWASYHTCAFEIPSPIPFKFPMTLHRGWGVGGRNWRDMDTIIIMFCILEFNAIQTDFYMRGGGSSIIYFIQRWWGSSTKFFNVIEQYVLCRMNRSEEKRWLTRLMEVVRHWWQYSLERGYMWLMQETAGNTNTEWMNESVFTYASPGSTNFKLLCKRGVLI